MIENEFKIMLSKEQYEKLLAMYDWDEVIEQTNHYYDTDDLRLSQERVTCRVREIAGEFFLQVKMPAGREFSRVELSEKLPSLPEIITKDELLKLSERELFDVKRIGQLFTKRCVKRFDGAEIDLDKSVYFSKTDYEAEIEFTDENAARKILSEIKSRIDMNGAQDVCAGKVRRFLEEFQKNKNPR